MKKGLTKFVQRFDDLESSREGAGARETTLPLVRKHLEDIGLDGDIAQYNEISGLSGGKPLLARFDLLLMESVHRPKNQACYRRMLVE